MNETLGRLAAVAGIEHEYWDGLGIHRQLHEATARALLEGLGFDPACDAQTHLDAIADESFLTPLPPSLVLRHGEAPLVAIALAAPDGAPTVVWEIALESGELRPGEAGVAGRAHIGRRARG